MLNKKLKKKDKYFSNQCYQVFSNWLPKSTFPNRPSQNENTYYSSYATVPKFT